MIADLVIVVSMRYLEKGLAAESNLRHIEEQHADQDRKMDKGEKLAQRQKAAKQHKKKGKGSSSSSSSISSSGGKNKKMNNIQQPSKRD